MLAFAFAIAVGLILMLPFQVADTQDQYLPGGTENLEIIPGSFIITLKPNFVGAGSANDTDLSNATLKKQEQRIMIKADEVNEELEKQGNGNVTQVYDRAIQGFTVEDVTDLSPLANDPAVQSIEANTDVPVDAQFISTGLDRIDLDKATTSSYRPDSRETKINVDVAVIDSGVHPHPDLNLFQSQVFIPGADTEIEEHATHVAGICCARDNLGGVVGAAQGARIWSLKVCGGEAGPDLCRTSSMIAANDYIIANAASIEIATQSIGGGNARGAAHDTSITNVINAGITFFQSAGNNAALCQAGFGCDHPTAIVVSALQDFDGRCGGLRNAQSASGATLRDDTLAVYSNYGPQIDIMAPGSLILSTWPFGGQGAENPGQINALYPYIGASEQGGYIAVSGTSMSTPLAAGVGAVIKVANPSFTPAQIKSNMQSNAYSQTLGCDGASKGGLVQGANSRDSSKLLWAQPY